MSDIRYSRSLAGVTPERLWGFFAGWPSRPTPETHLRLLRQSAAFVLAIDEATGQVVGFVTATGDGVLSAYIPFLEVLPEYQRRGIGSELVRRLLEELTPLYMIDLCCDAELEPFYRRLGFQPALGMLRRDRSVQGGRLEASG